MTARNGSSTAAEERLDEATADRTPPAPRTGAWTLAGAVVVLALAGCAQWLVRTVPEWTSGTAVGSIAEAIEYPVYAITLGFLGNAALSLTGVRARVTAAFRTELFIKIGLVLLGASIDLIIIARAFGPAVLQAVLLIAAVFAFTWWFAGVLGLDDRLRALLASALSICGVSAAVAAAGALEAKKEQRSERRRGPSPASSRCRSPRSSRSRRTRCWAWWPCC